MQHVSGHRSSHDTVYTRFKEYIINYRFRPNEQLQIPDLSERLRMGRTPLREALTRLHGESLVVGVPNRGFFAKMLTVEEMKARYELATLVLRHSIKKSSGRSNLKNIKDSMNIDFRRTGMPGDMTSGIYLSYAIFIESLYERIAALSGNTVMVDNIRSFNDQTRYVRMINMSIDQNIRQIATDMVALIEALERGDSQTALATLERQFETKLVRMDRLVNEGNLLSLCSMGPGDS